MSSHLNPKDLHHAAGCVVADVERLILTLQDLQVQGAWWCYCGKGHYCKAHEVIADAAGLLWTVATDVQSMLEYPGHSPVINPDLGDRV